MPKASRPDGCIRNNLLARSGIPLVAEHLVDVLGDLQHGVHVAGIAACGSERTPTRPRSTASEFLLHVHCIDESCRRRLSRRLAL